MIVAVHMCRGNMNAFWGGEGGYDLMAETAFNMSNVDAFLLEYDTPRAGDFKPLRHVPKGKQILLGIISNILTLSNIETFWISATYGAIILLSLIVTRLTSGKSYRSD